MTITRIYMMAAREAQAPKLADTILALAGMTRQLDGCEGVEVLIECDDPSRLVLIERWTSVAAHKAGAATRPDSLVQGIVALLVTPPSGAYYFAAD